MYEINLLVWPVVFAVTGVTWGARFGTVGAWVGGVLGVVAGLFTAGPYIAHLYYDLEFFAPWLLAATWWLPQAWRPDARAALCLAAWLRIGVGALARRRHARATAP